MAAANPLDTSNVAYLSKNACDQLIVDSTTQADKPASGAYTRQSEDSTTSPTKPTCSDTDINPAQFTPRSRVNSASTIQPNPLQKSNPPGRDLSRWLKQCRPFLLETIQRYTEQDVRAIALDKRKLRQHLEQHLYQGEWPDEGFLSTLNLVQTTIVDAEVLEDRTLTRLATTSETSVNSMSSQMSDSLLNDVQQSAAILRISLKTGIAEIAPSRLIDRMVQLFRVQDDHQKEKENLVEAMRKAKLELASFTAQMPSIGFSDIGLQLNQYDQNFRDDVLKFLSLEKKYKKLELRKRLDRTSEWKPWKSHERPGTWKPRDEYRFLAQRTEDVGKAVCSSLRSAIQTRDDFVSASAEEIEHAVSGFAQDTGYEVREKCEGNLLVERIFEKKSRLIDEWITVSGSVV